jgi:CcmD family protein
MQIDPGLQQIYADIMPNMPYLLAAYAVLWLGLLGYVGLALRRLGKLEKQLAIVEEAVAKRA